jgi:hypothetical protein
MEGGKESLLARFSPFIFPNFSPFHDVAHFFPFLAHLDVGLISSPHIYSHEFSFR